MTSLKSRRLKSIKEIEWMRNMAELKALSKYSLEHPLSDKQYNRMMELKKILFKH